MNDPTVSALRDSRVGTRFSVALRPRLPQVTALRACGVGLARVLTVGAGLMMILLLAGADAPASRPATQPATREALLWGEAHEGVQSALHADKTQFGKDERVGFLVSVRNVGKRDMSVVRSQETHEIELDGKWYRFFGDVRVQSSALPPGREYHDIRIWLDADWAPLGDPVKFKLTPGKHKLRVAVNARAFEAVARAVSGAVEFEVGK